MEVRIIYSGKKHFSSLTVMVQLKETHVLDHAFHVDCENFDCFRLMVGTNYQMGISAIASN